MNNVKAIKLETNATKESPEKVNSYLISKKKNRMSMIFK